MDDARRAAFDAVVTEVYEPLQRYLRRRCPTDDVDDLLNEVLLVIWRRLDDAPSGMRLPWSYGIARRCLANHRRGRTRRLRLVERVAAASTPVPAHDWIDAVDVELHEAVGRLGDLDREVVRLWAWERLEPREIAEVLDATPNAITVRLARVRRRLRLDLARQDAAGAGHEGHEGHPELEP
jgi:RNA polymerase sigma-70 factor (ECF subfamily)